jgi:hypothetical protein
MKVQKIIFLILRIILCSGLLFIVNYYTEQHLRFIYINKITDPFDGFLSAVLLFLNLPLFIIIEGEKLIQVEQEIFFYMIIFNSIAYGTIFGLFTDRDNFKNTSKDELPPPKKVRRSLE